MLPRSTKLWLERYPSRLNREFPKAVALNLQRQAKMMPEGVIQVDRILL
jgi:hypothetical protein